jgi:hypothetical protein
MEKTNKKVIKNWTGQNLSRNCLLKHIIEGKMEGKFKVTGSLRISHKQLLDDFKKIRGYWNLTQEAPACTHRRTRFGRGYGPFVRQATD